MITYKDQFVELEITNGILYCIYSEGLEIDLILAKKMFASRVAITRDNSYPVLVDGRRLKSISWEAREYFASPEGKKGITACALLAGTRLTNLIGNVFIKITEKKLDFPVRLFTDKNKAIDWLQQFKVNGILIKDTAFPG